MCKRNRFGYWNSCKRLPNFVNVAALLIDDTTYVNTGASNCIILFISMLIDNKTYLNVNIISGPKVIKLFSYSTQLNTKFILLINVKMPTIVGILIFISMINTSSERLKARNFFICQYISVYEQLKFHAQLS